MTDHLEVSYFQGFLTGMFSITSNIYNISPEWIKGDGSKLKMLKAKWYADDGNAKY
jgi:hypothetical protein